LILIAEIVTTSIVAEALFTFGWHRAFESFWGQLGEPATSVVEPAWGAAEAFAILALLLLLVLAPWMFLGYGLSYLLPKRWFEWGRPRWLPDDWLRKNPLITRRRALRFVVAGAAIIVVGWPLGILVADVDLPVVLLLLVAPFCVVSVDWFRTLTPRSRLTAIVGFLVAVMLTPTVFAALFRPHIERDGEQPWNLFFTADDLAVAHLATPDGERPVVILGATVLGDLVVYDACAEADDAEVVARADIIVPERLAPCP
jgi:hypothetical protein